MSFLCPPLPGARSRAADESARGGACVHDTACAQKKSCPRSRRSYPERSAQSRRPAAVLLLPLHPALPQQPQPDPLPSHRHIPVTPVHRRFPSVRHPPRCLSPAPPEHRRFPVGPPGQQRFPPAPRPLSPHPAHRQPPARAALPHPQKPPVLPALQLFLPPPPAHLTRFPLPARAAPALPVQRFPLSPVRRFVRLPPAAQAVLPSPALLPQQLLPFLPAVRQTAAQTRPDPCPVPVQSASRRPFPPAAPVQCCPPDRTGCCRSR